MPQAVLHVLVPLIIASLFKDWYDSRHKKKLPLHYVLIAGIAGLFPDLDIIVFWFLHFFGFTISEVHRTFTHTIFIPIIFLILFFIFMKADVKAKICNISKHKLKISLIFLAISFGTLVHIILDGIFVGFIMPFYPLSNIAIGLNIAGIFPDPLNNALIPSIDAVILVLWLLYIGLSHKVSDFI
jgi:membrane-bound metal-dependent hydrolase YbcI (DUF457 family)